MLRHFNSAYVVRLPSTAARVALVGRSAEHIQLSPAVVIAMFFPRFIVPALFRIVISAGFQSFARFFADSCFPPPPFTGVYNDSVLGRILECTPSLRHETGEASAGCAACCGPRNGAPRAGCHGTKFCVKFSVKVGR